MVNRNICMITYDAPFIDRRILLEASSLINAGFKVSIVYPFGDADNDFQEVGINYITSERPINLKKILVKTKGTLRKKLPQNIYTLLKKSYFKIARRNLIDYEKELFKKAIEQKYDIYVAHDLPALPIAHKAARFHNALLVYDAHEFYLGQIAVSEDRKRFFENIENKYIHDVNLMFTVNEDIAELFRDKYKIEDIHILYNAMNEQQITNHVSLHNLLKINNSKKIVLYQGGFLEDRNLEFLLNSACYLPNNIILVMLGYSFLEEKLKKMAIRMNILNKKVFFIDRVPQKKLLSYTSGADFGIIPYPDIDLNTKYCTPNKLFEFVMAEVPIIANKQLVTVNRILDKYKIGKSISFVSYEKTAEEIVNIINSMNIEEIKGNIKKAQTEMCWDFHEKILLAAYNNMLNRKK